MSAQSHQSDARILGRRTLQKDHRFLAGLLRQGQSVLDVGCGTGSITAGIAEAVGPQGSVLGIDRNAGLIEIASREHRLPNLQFECIDAAQILLGSQFDIVTAARTLQWISEPLITIQRMKDAAKPGGLLVVLDYNHADNAWDPHPPAEFVSFYHAFLSWRQANHWDNRMADHLPALFHEAGLRDIEHHVQDEIAQRGDDGFVESTKIWSEVIDNVGIQIADAGHFDLAKLSATKLLYEKWVTSELRKQTLCLRVIAGVV